MSLDFSPVKKLLSSRMTSSVFQMMILSSYLAHKTISPASKVQRVKFGLIYHFYIADISLRYCLITLIKVYTVQYKKIHLVFLL